MLDAQRPSWADLLIATLPEATKLARRIERQHLAGKTPQGVVFIAIAMLLGDLLRSIPEDADVDALTHILAEVISGKHHKPHLNA